MWPHAAICLMGHVTLMEEALMGKSPLCMFGVHCFSGIGDKTYDR